MFFPPSFRSWQCAAGALCLCVSVVAMAAPKKKESADTINTIRGKPKPAPTRKPAPGPQRTPRPPKPVRPVAKTSAGKPSRKVAPPTTPAVPTLYVSPGGKDPYTSVAAALAKAPKGARILLRTGVYTESLLLTRAVEIAPASPNDAVVIESPRGAAVTMRTDRATLRQLTLRQIPGAGIGDYTVEAPQGKLTLEECTLLGGDKAAMGVYGSGTAPRLRKCELRGKARGLHLFGRAKTMLEECVLLENSQSGALVESGAELTAKSSRFGGNGQDGLQAYAAAVSVQDCDFSANKRHGLAVYTTNVRLAGSRFYENLQDGVWLDEKCTGTIEAIECFRNKRSGLVFRGESEVHATGCKVYENQEGFVAGIKAGGTLEQSEITGNRLNAVIIKEGSASVLRKCRIVGGDPDAVHIAEGGRGTFEGCDISKTGKGSAALAVHGGSSPTFRQTRLSGGWWNAFITSHEPTFEDCDFVGANGPAIHIRDGSAPRLLSCRIRDSGEAGILFTDKGAGTLERCEITGSGRAGVQIMSDANPTLVGCTLSDSKAQGLFVDKGGRGTLLDCTIARNQGVGVGIHSGSTPLLKHCRIEGNSPVGVVVAHDGAGTLDGCLIAGNAGPGVEISLNGNPLVKGCTFKQNRGHGIVVSGNGRGTIESPIFEQNVAGNLLVPAGSKTVLRGAAGF